MNSPVNIGYTLGGTATDATATGLPAGVTLSVAGTAVTISGTPTVAGSYPYTITTIGNCDPVTATGTITVQEQTITLNTGNDNQTVCINTPIANIQYTIGGQGGGATITGLPSGVTGVYNSGLFIISGTPTVSGTFNYTITTSGALCTPATAMGSITVTPAAALTLTSGNNTQTICTGIAISDITYDVTDATDATVTGLPAGVTGSYAGGVFTITGTPTVGGTFNYTVTTSGGCGIATATGTLTVQEETVTLTSGNTSPSVCQNTPITDIVYTIGGTATGATVTGLPAGVTFSFAGTTVTISGTPTDMAGAYPYTVTVTGTCAQTTATGTITIQAAPIGGTLTSVSVCSGGMGSLTLSGQVGTIVRWESSTDNFATAPTAIANTTITQGFNNITVPTQYRVVVNNGCGSVFSSVATVSIHNYWVGGDITKPTDWNTATNWSDGLVPSTTLCSDVYIALPLNGNLPVVNAAVPCYNQFAYIRPVPPLPSMAREPLPLAAR